MKALVFAVLVVAALTVSADLYAPTFTSQSLVVLDSVDTLIGAAANCASESLERQRYNFRLWHKRSEDSTRFRMVVNSNFVRRTEHGGPFGFPGTTYFPFLTTAQDAPDPWDKTLSSTWGYELIEAFDYDAFGDSGVPRSDMRTWDLYWRTPYAFISEPYGDDPCAGLTGVVADHCNRCTICNMEPGRGYCPNTTDVNALLFCVDECYNTAMADDCWIQMPRVLSPFTPTGVPLTYTLSYPDFQFPTMTMQTLSILNDCHAHNNTCPYCDVGWAHTHPNGIPDSDLSPPTVSFEYDVYDCPLGSIKQSDPCVKIETVSYHTSA